MVLNHRWRLLKVNIRSVSISCWGKRVTRYNQNQHMDLMHICAEHIRTKTLGRAMSRRSRNIMKKTLPFVVRLKGHSAMVMSCYLSCFSPRSPQLVVLLVTYDIWKRFVVYVCVHPWAEFEDSLSSRRIIDFERIKGTFTPKRFHSCIVDTYQMPCL